MVKFVTDPSEFDALVAASTDKLLVVDFTASWCGPCRYVAPEFEKLAELNPNVVFMKVDVDDASEIAAKCGISAMPTFHYYKGGEKVAEVVGADVDKIKALVATHA